MVFACLQVDQLIQVQFDITCVIYITCNCICNDKVSFIKENYMDKVYINLLMVLLMKDLGNIIKEKVININ